MWETCLYLFLLGDINVVHQYLCFFIYLFINSKYVQSIYVMQSDVTDSRIEARKHIELCVFQMNHSNQRSEH